jgi:hypothetical protein
MKNRKRRKKHTGQVRWVHGSLHSTGRLPGGSNVELHSVEWHKYRACFSYSDGRFPEELIVTGNLATVMGKVSKILRGLG